jgi:hypothetical protein
MGDRYLDDQLLCPLAVSKILDDMGTNRYKP